MANQGITMKVKSGNKYVTLYPQTLTNLIENNNLGEVFRAEVELLVEAWDEDFQQEISIENIKKTDIPMATKILEGSVEEMKKQENAYNKLDPIVGIYADEGVIRFTCISKPENNFKVQVYWTR